MTARESALNVAKGYATPGIFGKEKLQAIENKERRLEKREARDCPSRLRVNKGRQAAETLRVRRIARERISEVSSR